MTTQMKSNIYVTGFSGTGKTTVSRDLARLLNWRFVDLDDEIIEAAGKTIPKRTIGGPTTNPTRPNTPAI